MSPKFLRKTSVWMRYGGVGAGVRAWVMTTRRTTPAFLRWDPARLPKLRVKYAKNGCASSRFLTMSETTTAGVVVFVKDGVAVSSDVSTVRFLVPGGT